MSRYPSFEQAEQLHRTTFCSGSGGDRVTLILMYPQWQPASYVALGFVGSGRGNMVVMEAVGWYWSVVDEAELND